MFFVERYFAARQFESTPNWHLRAFIFNIVQLVLTVIAGFTWDQWMQSVSLLNGQEMLGTMGCVISGYLLITFVFYWWHRWRHEVQFLWLYLHQLHHSPRRIELITSFYKHPLEIFINSFITSFILYVLLGVGMEAASITIAITGVAELIYHWNIKTPYWLGFIFQRPESHLIHHREGWHQNNYSDLPLWDILFGTFYNPKEIKFKCGYKDNKESKVIEMLCFVDVNPRKAKI